MDAGSTPAASTTYNSLNQTGNTRKFVAESLPVFCFIAALLLLTTSCGITQKRTSTKILWGTFIAGQVLSAGNINYLQVISNNQHQEPYYEQNPIYGSRPSKTRVYATKIAETALIYGVTKIYPEYENHILIGSNVICWGFIANDHMHGISMGVRY